MIIHVVICQDLETGSAFADCAYHNLEQAEKFAKEQSKLQEGREIYFVSAADVVDETLEP